MIYKAVSLGGVVFGLGILVWVGVRWWTRQRPKWKPLLPFAICIAYGMLVILSAGGILGGLAGFTLWGSSTLGNAALEYGVGAGAPSATRAHDLILTDSGKGIVLLVTVGLIAAWKFSKKLPKGDIALGALCGVSLGLSSSIVSIAAIGLVRATNLAGLGLAGIL